MNERSAAVERNTLETRIKMHLQLDGAGNGNCQTGVGFFDHMLDQIARHGQFDIDVEAVGDRHIDDHHTVEDVGIVLGQAFTKALGDRRGITRYGHAFCPLDEALTRVVVDLSGRPGLYFRADFPAERIGQFDVELVREFWQGFVNHASVTLHVDVLAGDNAHHTVESLFKAAGRALRMAVAVDTALQGAMPSTKGSL